MLYTALFLISCILISRKFEKEKMIVASAAYSVLFVVLLLCLLFVTDFAPVRDMLSCLLGRYVYESIHFGIIETFANEKYGWIMTAALSVAFAVQLYAAFIRPVQKVIENCISGKYELFRRRKKACTEVLCIVQTLYLHRKINRLYCRMLN